MNPKTFERIPAFAAVLLVVLIVAACAMQLRDDKEQTNTSTSADVTSYPLATKLRECRSVTSEQKDTLAECRKAWTEERRQFLRQKPAAPSGAGAPPAGASLFVAPKDESRLPSGYPSIQQTGKE
ncbi:putative entry exclusion protein TrbK-alt [Bradyrhizobium sp.]|uniref:putative entry exclusion protein TrbK-alt n=1 Tax=Bradyrhizobium sp. TaxID=376 RepID=UPI0023901821|nr:putative entry exclusion protein TrbK-alt [Bradyrhizobium sp.]MDE1936504.1 putative entry exclusion protein TrbK-alt [Bradyrhizobium sp.]